MSVVKAKSPDQTINMIDMSSGNGDFDHVIKDNDDSVPGISTILIERFELEG